MSNLILKYNISEKDLYSLGIVESKKKSVGYLEKEKLKAVSLKILKPYNVKFMDLGGVLSEIKQGRFDNKYSESISQEEKSEIEKMIQENSNVSKFYKEWWSGKSKIQKGVIVIAVLFTLGLMGNLQNGGGSGMCECKENYWDPNDKKYGNTMSLEDTGNLGGMNLAKRSNMYNHFNSMVSFKDLSDSDKKLRRRCLDKYYSKTEVMMSKCN
jgi:hypothetical protein